MLNRRKILSWGAATAALSRNSDAEATDKWGSDQRYPTGWGGRFSLDPQYRVGNYSGGFEKMFPYLEISASPAPQYFDESQQSKIGYFWKSNSRTPLEYLSTWSTTGLLICRDSHILCEYYRQERTPQMRLTSWSMAKSITSLLLGICIDKQLIDSYDDLAKKYLPELSGTLHGSISLRNLSNMSSGADILHDRDNKTIYPSAFFTKSSNISRTVSDWNRKQEEQGLRFNYNELCPLTLGMVIRRVTGSSLSKFLQEQIWHPIGAENNATWTTDSLRNEFNCIGLAATLRDWAKIGVMVANRGRANGRVIVSDSWINEITSWSDKDQQVRYGVASRRFGYKAHMWHNKPDGSRLYFNGHHGQRVIVDMPTKTVLVHTAVDNDGDWEAELFALFEAALVTR